MYTVGDAHDGYLTTNLCLLHADAQRIARWMIGACWLVKREYFNTPERADSGPQVKYLSMTQEDIDESNDFGRILSTTRPRYHALFPEANVNGDNWFTVVRAEYQRALFNDTNWLIVAWAYGRAKGIK
jgi:hypothetical protein